ncbi:MAG: hypothetical protein ABS68_11770 [Niastella sp. SCN 39-18]|nr:hypothetical protein [Sphingobacteriales bacterium]ODT51827.1 MAG: hypothetical protein ABS68_11770 [Niastella sp. SCN 39-18]OJW10080.1 MAG: hypothetical protein BGO53_05980 [Sphingobacteriales bacterium 39-19]
MASKYYFLLGFILLFSCKGRNAETVPIKDSHYNTVERPSKTMSCFEYHKNKDTISLHIANKEDSILGELYYNLYEKDKNSGTVRGIMMGTTLYLDYTFYSEGKQSVRQVAFKLKGGYLVEGYGDMMMKNGVSYFKDTAALHFNDSLQLKEVECPQVNL